MLARRFVAPVLLRGALLGAILLVSLFVRPAGATLLKPFDLRGLSRAADAVVRARVEAQESRRDEERGRIYTYSTLEVLEVVKGERVPARITVKQIGGSAGELAMVVPGTADLRVGEEVVLFLRTDGTFYYLVGMHQGKYGVRRDEVGAFVTREPLPKTEPAGDGQAGDRSDDRATVRHLPLVPKSGAAGSDGVARERRTLDGFVAAVRQHLAELEQEPVAPSGAPSPLRTAPAPATAPAPSTVTQ